VITQPTVEHATGLLSPAHDELVRRLLNRAGDYGTAAGGWHRVGSPIVLDKAALDRDVAGIRRLVELAGSIRELAFDGDPVAYHRFLGLDPGLADLLVDEGLGTDYFARPDCVLSGGRLRVLELNIGTGTVNITAAAATEVYFAAATPYETERDALGVRWRSTELSPSAGLACALLGFGGGAPVGLWYHDHDGAVLGRVDDLCAVLGAHGVAAVPVPTCEAAAFPGPLYAYFSILHLLGRDGSEVARVIRSTRHRTAPVLVRPGDVARTMKTNLAVLHRLAETGRLSSSDTEVVRTHLPETVIVEATDKAVLDRLRHERDDWVVKPAASFKGQGVHVGRSTSQDRWERVLRHETPSVAQRYVPADPVGVLVDPATDPHVLTDGRLVIMPHIMAGRFAGVSARFAPDRDVLGLVDFADVHPAMCVAATPLDGSPA
jgi:hypothetical protein